MTAPEFDACRQWLEASCDAAKAYDDLAAAALAAYGDHGPLVSGCVRDHFPAATKAALRYWASLASHCLRVAHDCRPPRVRTSTMRALGAEIAARRGSGRYGPSPNIRPET